MANRCVIKVGGIEYEYERAMKEAGIEDVLKPSIIFLIIGPGVDGRGTMFKSWLAKHTRVLQPHDLNDFYQSCYRWYNKMSNKTARPGLIGAIRNLLSRQKKGKFIREDMGVKLVSKVGGIGHEHADDLSHYADIKYARQLFGYFLVIGPHNEQRFKVWFYVMTSANRRNQELCYHSLLGWYERMRENNDWYVPGSLVSTVDGIDVDSENRLYDMVAITTAEQLFGKFLIIGPQKREVFKSWVGQNIQLNENDQEACYKSLFGRYKKFFEHAENREE